MMLASLLAATTACGHGAPPDTRALGAERTARLEKIAANCGVPPASLRLDGLRDLHVQPPPDIEFERIDCVLRAIRTSGLPIRMGFVGNESYEPNSSIGNQQ